MDGVWGDFLRPLHSTTPAEVITNGNKMFSSFKRKKTLNEEDGPDCTVSNN